MTRDEVKKYLLDLSQTKMAELFYEVMEDLPEKSSKLYLAEACFSSSKTPAYVSLVGLPPKGYPISSSDREDLINNGTCNRCKVEVTSWVKGAVCPVCSENVGLT